MIKTFLVFATICFGNECHIYQVDQGLSAQDCELLPTDGYLMDVIDPLLFTLPDSAEVIRIECGTLDYFDNQSEVKNV